MNMIISYHYRFENEEVTTNFVAMLKSLAVRLDSESIKLFFNEVRERAMSRMCRTFRCTRGRRCFTTTQSG
jgi:hypothetical protein